MRGPPISVVCECGEKRSLRYGERWTCERCARTWDTGQIPVDEYRQLVRDVRLPKLVALGAAGALALAIAVTALLVNLGLLLTLPILLGGIAILAGPPWKRWLRRRVAGRPRWELTPE